jgi:cbb3-type cytochrome oxidase subunit 1
MITIGFLLMMISLQIGGLVQGAMWLNGDTVYKALPELKPYLVIRAIAGAMIVISGIMQAWQIYKTVTVGAPITAKSPAPASEALT